LAVPQLELIPGLLAGLFLLSPGAPVNNCRWASIQWTWDQCRKSDPGTCTGPAAVGPNVDRIPGLQASSSKQQATSYKQQAASLTKKNKGL